MFDAYNQWLFGPVENLAAYDNWTKTHTEEYNGFNTFQKKPCFQNAGRTVLPGKIKLLATIITVNLPCNAGL